MPFERALAPFCEMRITFPSRRWMSSRPWEYFSFVSPPLPSPFFFFFLYSRIMGRISGCNVPPERLIKRTFLCSVVAIVIHPPRLHHQCPAKGKEFFPDREVGAFWSVHKA